MGCERSQILAALTLTPQALLFVSRQTTHRTLTRCDTLSKIRRSLVTTKKRHLCLMCRLSTARSGLESKYSQAASSLCLQVLQCSLFFLFCSGELVPLGPPRNLALLQPWSSVLSLECFRKEEASSSLHVNDLFFTLQWQCQPGGNVKLPFCMLLAFSTDNL